MKVAFIFGVLTALVSISLSNGFVVQKQERNNTSQEIKPDEKQALSQKETPIEVKPNQQMEKPSQITNEQAKIQADPGHQQNKNQSLNLNQQDVKKNQQKENEKSGQSPERRNFDDDVSIYKRFEVRKRAEDTEAMRAENEEPNLRSQNYPQELESIVMAVDTGAQPRENKFRASPDAMDRIEQMIQDLTKTKIPSDVIYRAKQDLDIKPSFVRFKSSQQPTLKLDITSSSIVKALETLLATPEARRYADVIAQQAAVMYRSISDKKVRGLKKNLGNNGYDTRSLYNKH